MSPSCDPGWDPGCLSSFSVAGSDSTLPVDYGYQTQIQVTAAGQASAAANTAAGGGVTSWLNANSKTVLLAAGILAGVLLLTGGRRR